MIGATVVEASGCGRGFCLPSACALCNIEADILEQVRKPHSSHYAYCIIYPKANDYAVYFVK
jgi:hypothetical protein